MTRSLKVIPTLLTAFGAALPTATKDHRGQLVWKRAAATEDAIYAGVVDSSNASKFRQLITDVQGSPILPFYENVVVANSAVTASTSSTSAYSVNVQNTSFDLPSGTWSVFAWGDGLYGHSSANGVVRVHMQIGADAGTALTAACQADPGRTSIGIANLATGQTGTIEIRMEYRPNSTGTAYAGGGWLMAMAFRTS